MIQEAELRGVEKTSLNSDTSAVAIRPTICVRLYYDGGLPTQSKCQGDGAWFIHHENRT